MTTYELFQQGPAVYIPVILVSLVITLVLYSAFPLLFARLRKKTITKRKYNLLCFGINFLVMIVFAVINGGASSGGSYLLWTGIFSASGLKVLKSRCVLDDSQFINTSTSTEKTAAIEPLEASVHAEKHHGLQPAPTPPPITFCRKCGNRLIEGSHFCGFCGTAIVRGGQHEMS